MDKHENCNRCGRCNMRWCRRLTSGRLVCFWCYADLPFSPDNLVIDDGVTKTWEETQVMRKQYRAGMRKLGKWEAADAH